MVCLLWLVCEFALLYYVSTFTGVELRCWVLVVCGCFGVELFGFVVFDVLLAYGLYLLLISVGGLSVAFGVCFCIVLDWLRIGCLGVV